MAVGTVVLTTHDQVGPVRRIVITATASSTDGSFPTATLQSLGLGDVSGRLLVSASNPGAVAPTDNWDYALTDEDGLNRMGSSGTDRDTTTSERVALTDTYIARGETLTLAITGNSVNSAVIVLTFIYTPQP